MTANRKPSFQWDHVYRAAIDGREYPWPVRSQLGLAIGHRFFLPLAVEVMVNPEFARPIWKPRLSPNFVGVEVVEVEGERLLLRKGKNSPAGDEAGQSRKRADQPVPDARHFTT